MNPTPSLGLRGGQVSADLLGFPHRPNKRGSKCAGVAGKKAGTGRFSCLRSLAFPGSVGKRCGRSAYREAGTPGRLSLAPAPATRCLTDRSFPVKQENAWASVNSK